MFHAFGLTTLLVCPLCLASTSIQLGRFSPAATVAAIRRHTASVLFAVPAMLAAVAALKSVTPEDLASLEYIISGGAPLPAALGEVYQARFGKTVLEGYGLTETSPVLSLNTPQMHRAGSVGRPLPNAEIRIVDESGVWAPTGQIGEVLARGPMVTRGYHNLPEATALAFTSDGFYRTGDLGMLDAEGYLHITGRKKEMIIIGGEKVYAREIEELLLRHPAVVEAAVVAEKCPLRGEMIVAYVHARTALTRDALRNFCHEAGLPHWKHPREYVFLDALPRSPTGKVLKRELVRAQA